MARRQRGKLDPSVIKDRAGARPPPMLLARAPTR
jgi:hypothetical protein